VGDTLLRFHNACRARFAIKRANILSQSASGGGPLELMMSPPEVIIGSGAWQLSLMAVGQSDVLSQMEAGPQLRCAVPPTLRQQRSGAHRATGAHRINSHNHGTARRTQDYPRTA
jgi:hypothetical protein